MVKQDIPYEVRRSRRARSLRLSVSSAGTVRLTVPRFVSLRMAEYWFTQKEAWLRKVLAKIKPQTALPLVCALPKDILLGYISEQASSYARQLGIAVPAVRLMKAKTRWGSCSLKTRKVAINERLGLAPLSMLRYVIAHEVAHLVYPNHSKKFWAVVGNLCGDYKSPRVFLKTFNPHKKWGLNTNKDTS